MKILSTGSTNDTTRSRSSSPNSLSLSSTENSLSTVLMQENHNDQPIKLTYPVEIQLSDPNETNDSNQPMEQDTESSIRREDITFTLVEQHSSSDKENDGRLIKAEEDIGNSNSESQVFPTSVTPSEETDK